MPRTADASWESVLSGQKKQKEYDYEARYFGKDGNDGGGAVIYRSSGGLPRPGQRTGRPGAYRYVWKRGVSADAVDEVISGAAQSGYTLKAEDLDKYLTVTVSGEGYSGGVTSPPAAKVKSANAAPPVIASVTVEPFRVNVAKGGSPALTQLSSASNSMYVTLDLSAWSVADNVIGRPEIMLPLKNSRYVVGITLRDSLTSIGNFAFSGCGSLESITIPAGVMSIGNSAFSSCESLRSVTFEEADVDFEASAFYGNLRNKYTDGGAGTYTRYIGPAWTKQ